MYFLHEFTLVEKDVTVMVLDDIVDKDSIPSFFPLIYLGHPCSMWKFLGRVESVPQATAVRMPDSQPPEPQRNSLFAPYCKCS